MAIEGSLYCSYENSFIIFLNYLYICYICALFLLISLCFQKVSHNHVIILLWLLDHLSVTHLVSIEMQCLWFVRTFCKLPYSMWDGERANLI